MAILTYRVIKGNARSNGELRHLTPMIGSIITALSPLTTIIFTIPYRETLESDYRTIGKRGTSTL
ncbi:hypothetical protein PMAYCL1PPCAC_31668 [Pristionchus mayeri]|uniref:G protein-coupled receptor n=1 Tax=Pristionchus mayeri TaxID=1317129 RepID=A0AAN5DDD8_9BILA|nr:hypothetical protein PMAYCL1PPCAC_31668 [Pristionchus mayeri]